jgi:hypothetical protein
MLKYSKLFSENSTEVQQKISEYIAEIQETIFQKQCWNTINYFPKIVQKYSRMFSENSAEVQPTIFRK